VLHSPRRNAGVKRGTQCAPRSRQESFPETTRAALHLEGSSGRSARSVIKRSSLHSRGRTDIDHGAVADSRPQGAVAAA
jgi:hypothetical protein